MGQKLQYTGLFNGNGVCIIDKTQASELYSFGTYGKGILSRSRPLFFHNIRTYRGSAGMFHNKEVKKLNGKKRGNVCSDGPHISSTLNSKTSNSSSNYDEDPIAQHFQDHKTIQEAEEYLQLSLVEAFYLAYGLGCLKVMLPDGIQVSLLECWNLFRAVDTRFCELYVAYHYYRAGGWVPRAGPKYGVDFVLYCAQGPQSFHAQYAVIVAKHTQEGKHQSEGYTAPQHERDTPQPTWGQLNHVTRLNEHVAKGLVVCHVSSPVGVGEVDGTDEPASGLLSLPLHRIAEVVVQRFVHQS